MVVAARTRRRPPHLAVTELGIDRFLAAAVARGRAAVRDRHRRRRERRTATAGPTARTPERWSLDEFLPLLARPGSRTPRGSPSTAARWVGTAPCGWRRSSAAAGPRRSLCSAPRSGSRGGGYSSVAASPTRRSTTASRCSATRATSTASRSASTAAGEDPFYPADRAYVAGFDRPITATFEDGAHDPAYWTRMLPAQLAFVGRRLH